MKLFRDEGIIGLQDAGPTLKFIKIINNVIRIMNSRTPGDSLKWNTNDRKVRKLVFTINISIFINVYINN